MTRRPRPGRRLRRVATTTHRHDRHERRRGGGRQLSAERRQQRRDELAARRQLAARYRRLGGRRGQRRRFGGRILFETKPAPIEASTGSLEAIYPFQIASRSQPATGMVIGPSPTGGAFTFDPWVRYRQGRLTNPNLLILGDVGSGKSALAKTLVWRGLEFGRGAQVIDPKGEYGPLAAAAGTVPIDLHPGGNVVLNPLDPGVAGPHLAPTELFHRNLATLRALLEAVLGRACRQLELVLLAASLARLGGLDPTELDHDLQVRSPRHGQTVTLPQIAEVLISPDDTVAARVNMDPAAVIDESRELALAAARLVDPHGDLGGMFAGHTTIDTATLGALAVVDIHHIYRHHRPLLPLVMIAVAAWLQLATGGDTRGRFQVNDEAWALLSDEASARWMQANTKLSRALSLSVVNVLHRLSDTAAAGTADSTTRALAEGVIADSGTWIIYRQKPSEQPLLRHILQLNELQTGLATRLGRGRGLWVVNGDRREISLVDHVLAPTEAALIDTDQPMHDADATSRS
jgi:hypothetical protein